MIKRLLDISNKLDEAGLHKEADFLDAIIKVAAKKKKKPTKKQLDALDADGDGKIEKEDFVKLRSKSKKDDKKKKCHKCGTMNEPDAKFCKNCGTKLK